MNKITITITTDNNPIEFIMERLKDTNYSIDKVSMDSITKNDIDVILNLYASKHKFVSKIELIKLLNSTFGMSFQDGMKTIDFWITTSIYEWKAIDNNSFTNYLSKK